jgi:hypothetical protein
VPACVRYMYMHICMHTHTHTHTQTHTHTHNRKDQNLRMVSFYSIPSGKHSTIYDLKAWRQCGSPFRILLLAYSATSILSLLMTRSPFFPYLISNVASPVGSFLLERKELRHARAFRFKVLARNFASAVSEISGRDIIFDLLPPQCR